MPKAPKPIADNTFEVELLGKDKVEIGDKESTDFKPHIKLNRWDGECFIKVSLPTTEKPTPIVEGGKVKFGGKDIEAHFYPLEPTTVIAKDKEGNDVEFTQNELGGFEFEVILKKKPPTNKIVLDIETQGLKFYYQPALTQEEIDEGCIRPDNVVGSYAVYHQTQDKLFKTKAEGDKYRTGIAFHIYRPKITDADSKWVWGKLSIDEQASTLTITIDQTWLDSAIYPVSIDPNFGYETLGGSTTTVLIINHYWATKYACSESATAVSITCAFRQQSNNLPDIHFVVYDDDAGYPGSRVDYSLEWTLTGGWDDWKTLALTQGGALSAADYWLTFLAERADNSNVSVRFYYNTLTASNYYKAIEHFSPADPFPSGGSSLSNWKTSIYCTYEVAVGEFTQAVGGGSISIAGVLGRNIFISVGAGSVSISGSLASVLTFFQTVGSGAVSIAGTLGRAISIAVGDGSVAISGTLTSILKFFQIVGSGSITIAGALTSVLTIFQTVGSGAVAIASTLNRLIKLAVGSFTGWLSPTGHNDPASGWTDESNAYDDDTDTYAISDTIGSEEWSSYLELTITAMHCNAIRYYGNYASPGIDQISVDVYYGSVWVNIYEGIFSDLAWDIKNIPTGTQSVTKARVKFYNSHPFLGASSPLYEFDFWSTGAVAIAGALGLKTFISVGAGAITSAATLGRKIALTVGSGSVSIAGALGRKIFIGVGAGAVGIAGALSSVLTHFVNVGSGSVAIAGALGLKIKLAVGSGSIAISGALAAALTFFQNVGSGSIAIAGTLSRNIFLSVGAGSIAISGTLGRLIKIGVGAGSITISGTLSTIKTIFQTVGSGSVAIAGSLATSLLGLFYQAVGGGTVAISGALSARVKVYLRQQVSRMGTMRLTVSRMAVNRLNVSRMPLYRWITRRLS